VKVVRIGAPYNPALQAIAAARNKGLLITMRVSQSVQRVFRQELYQIIPFVEPRPAFRSLGQNPFRTGRGSHADRSGLQFTQTAPTQTLRK
jgi:hypothetical protein